MKNHAFFGFSKYLHLVTVLVKKIFAFRYLFTIYIFNDAARRRHPLSRGGKAMSPPAAGVATRRFAFSSLLQSGQSVACNGIAQLKKTQAPLDICYLFLEESQKTSVLGCGINRKCLVFRLEFFCSLCLLKSTRLTPTGSGRE